MKKIKYYKIMTDGGQAEVEAATVGRAIEAWGEAPIAVRTAEQFGDWLERAGGYGWIEEDGVRIIEVRA